MNNEAPRTVLDCMIYAQALINPLGPVGECIERGTRGDFLILLSPHVISEIRELPEKLPPKFAITPEKVAIFLDGLLPTSLVILDVPHLFDHPIDPDDSPYVDLAIAADAQLIVSRDRHLLGLSDPAKPWSTDFRARFPQLMVIAVDAFLAQLRARSLKNPPS